MNKDVYFANIWPQILTKRGKELFARNDINISGNWLDRRILDRNVVDLLIYPPADFDDSLKLWDDYEHGRDIKKIIYILFPDNMIGWDHNTNRYKFEFAQRYQNLLSEGFNQVLSHSQHSLDLIRRVYSVGQSQVIPLGIDFENIHAINAGKKSNMNVLWNHAWRPDKGAFEAFQVINNLAQHNPNINFSVGQWWNWGGNSESLFYKNKCLPELKALKELENVHFVGRIKPYEEYWQFLATHDLSFSTSYHEGFGLGMLEQAAAGIATILPREEVYPEIYPSQLVTDRQNLVEKIQTLIESPQEVSQLKEAAIDTASRYDVSRWVDNLGRVIYEE